MCYMKIKKTSLIKFDFEKSESYTYNIADKGRYFMKKVSSFILCLIIVGYYSSQNKKNQKLKNTRNQLAYEYNVKTDDLNNKLIYEYNLKYNNSNNKLLYQYK